MSHTQGWLDRRLPRGALSSSPWAPKQTVGSSPAWRPMEPRPSSSSAPLPGREAGPSSRSTEMSRFHSDFNLSDIIHFTKLFRFNINSVGGFWPKCIFVLFIVILNHRCVFGPYWAKIVVELSYDILVLSLYICVLSPIRVEKIQHCLFTEYCLL